MDYVNLGRTGLKVSRLTLGCMTFGAPDRGFHSWTLPEAQSRPLIRQALEMGINFLDTANVYSDGELRGDRGPGAEGLRPPRRGRDRHQGARPHAPGPERRRACRARRS